MRLLVEHAREILVMADELDGYQFEAIGLSIVSTSAKLLRVKGAVAPLITRGKRKGRPNWRKADKATEREVFFTPEEHDEWCRKWEIRTGTCSECMGKGEVFAQWSITNGTTFKPCKVCGATGKAHNAK